MVCIAKQPEKAPDSPPRMAKTARRRPQKTHPKVLGPADSITTSAPTSQLLGLPEEVQSKIFEYVLTSDSGYLYYIPSSDARPARFNLDSTGANLRLTCHEIALETEGMLLGCNTLVFSQASDFLAWLKRVKQKEEARGKLFTLGPVKIRPSLGQKFIIRIRKDVLSCSCVFVEDD